LPTTADEAIETMERLDEVTGTRNATLEKFGAALIRSGCRAGARVAAPERGRTTVYHLCLPSEMCTTQIDEALFDQVVVPLLASVGLELLHWKVWTSWPTNGDEDDGRRPV
jgi:hypothetical protein